MKRVLNILLFVVFITYIHSEGNSGDCRWFTWCATIPCGGTSGTSQCDGNGIPCKLKDQNKLRVVVEVNPNYIGSNPMFMAFCVTLDQLSALSVNGSARYLMKNPNSYIRLHVGNKNYVSSDKQPFFGSGNTTFVTFYSTIFKMNYGVFIGFDNNTAVNSTPISFENTCDAGNNKCIMDLDQPCVASMHCGAYYVRDRVPDDVLIYIGFDGTDADYRPLRSSGMMPARLRAFSWWSYYDEVRRVFVPN
jgi:hypothetical protein